MSTLAARSLFTFFVIFSSISGSYGTEEHTLRSDVKWGTQKLVKGAAEVTIGAVTLLAFHPEIVTGAIGYMNSTQVCKTEKMDDLSGKAYFPDKTFSDTMGTCPLSPPDVIPHASGNNLTIPMTLKGLRSCELHNDTGQVFGRREICYSNHAYILGSMRVLVGIQEPTAWPALLLTGHGCLEMTTGAVIIVSSVTNQILSTLAQHIKSGATFLIGRCWKPKVD